jgi:3-hydroxyisobutyrate dehydrogenase-like beta-hydroxyacid dehydrogenase
MQAPLLGFIGLGEMGGPMSASLLAAGYAVVGFDLRPPALEQLVAQGGRGAASAAAIVEQCDWVLCMLPSSEAFVTMAEHTLLPHLRPGQLVIELGTSMPNAVRRLATAIEARGAGMVDSPVSGGAAGAEARQLRMFVGASAEQFTQVRPILAAMGGTDAIFHCGAVGSGSVMKGVNQLKMGLEAAIHLEILAFAHHEGLDPLLAERVYGSTGPMSFGSYPRRVAEGRAQSVGVKFRELPYYLRQAEEKDYRLPLTAALHSFCDRGERVVVDDHRPAPSFWHELTRDRT